MFVKRVDYIVIQSHRISRLASLSMKIRILQPYIAFKINIMDSNSLNQQIMNVYAIPKKYLVARCTRLLFWSKIVCLSEGSET